MTSTRQPLRFFFRRRVQLAVTAPMFLWLGLASGHWFLSQAAEYRLRVAARAGARAAALRGATDAEVHAAVVRSLQGSPLKAGLDRPRIAIAGSDSGPSALTKAMPGDTLVVRLSANYGLRAAASFRFFHWCGAKQGAEATGAARKR